MKKLLITSALSAVLLLGASACSDDTDNASAGADSGEATNVLLASSQPDTADGQDLGLSRVVIPAGVELASHTHPGVQMAYIAEGTLTYTVYTGEVVITRKAGTGDAAEETITAGTTTEIHAGDSLVELPGMVHGSSNQGDEDVVIYLSTLFETGAPASSLATQ